MPSIKLGSSSSSSNSLDYVNQKEKIAQKNQKLSQKQQEINQKIETTKEFLRSNGVSENIINNITGRAVVTNGYNCSMDNEAAKTQFKMTRNIINNHGSIQARTIIQSFSTKELNATNPKDWQKANEIGMKLAQKVAHNHQAYVATHIDNENHLVHNHIVYSPVNFKTGKKEHWKDKHQRAQFFRQANDEVSLEYGMNPIIKQGQKDQRTFTERQLKQKKAYVWKDDLRHRIDTAVMDSNTYNWHNFVENLNKQDVQIEHNKRGSMTFVFIDKSNQKRKTRPDKLGTSYEKGVISNELGNREKRLESIKRNTNRIKQRTFGRDSSSESNDREHIIKSELNRRIKLGLYIQKNISRTKKEKRRSKHASYFNSTIGSRIPKDFKESFEIGQNNYRAKKSIEQFKSTNIQVSSDTNRFGSSLITSISKAIKEARKDSEAYERREREKLEEQNNETQSYNQDFGGFQR